MGIKMGNAVKNCQKNGLKKNLEPIARFLTAKERKCDSLSYHSLERFAHGRSFLKSDKSESFLVKE